MSKLTPREVSPVSRIGVLATSPVRSLRDWVSLCERVEELGYGALYANDHLAVGSLAPMPALAVAAASTSTVSLGPLVLNESLYHPSLIARDAATLEDFAPGRTVLGLGMGWMREDFAAVGVRVTPPADRLARLAECVDAVRQICTGELTSFDGDHFGFGPFRLVEAESKPLSIPIIIGGGGRRVLSLAARRADIVSLNLNLASAKVGPEAFQGSTMAGLATKISAISQAAAGFGRDSVPRIQLMINNVGIDGEAAAAQAALAARAGLSAARQQDCPHVLIGTAGHVAGKLAAMLALGVDQLVIRDNAMSQIAGVCSGMVR